MYRLFYQADTYGKRVLRYQKKQCKALEITTKIGCTISCTYCPQDKIIGAYKKKNAPFLMELEVFKRCIDKVPPDTIIYFSGLCEGWLNPECTKMVMYAGERKHPMGIFSTLAGMNCTDIEALRSIPLISAFVHLPSEEGYENIIVNEHYLKLLRKAIECIPNVDFVIVQGTPHHSVIPLLTKDPIRLPLSHRAGNHTMKNHSMISHKKKGRIDCAWNLTNNVLLPNGDVVLCCMDYSMSHVLGNLLTSDYTSLFSGDEFNKIKDSLINDEIDTLCRHCDTIAYSVDLSARMINPMIYLYDKACSIKEPGLLIRRSLSYLATQTTSLITGCSKKRRIR